MKEKKFYKNIIMLGDVYSLTIDGSSNFTYLCHKKDSKSKFDFKGVVVNDKIIKEIILRKRQKINSKFEDKKIDNDINKLKHELLTLLNQSNSLVDIKTFLQSMSRRTFLNFDYSKHFKVKELIEILNNENPEDYIIFLDKENNYINEGKIGIFSFQNESKFK